MELDLSLGPDLPVRIAVERTVRAAIEQGVLVEGARLPSSRDLAEGWGIARGTVVTALDDLIAEGVLMVRARVGVFVARSTTPAGIVPVGQPRSAPTIDLRAGRPENGSFPALRWQSALRRALAAASAPGAGSTQGLRHELAGYLRRARGVEARPEQILVCSGFRSASTILAATLARRDARVVAIEDPSLPAVELPWVTAGFMIRDLLVDDDGARVDSLDSGIDVAVLTPSHQFPLGGVLAPERRRTVLEWATGDGRYVLEDDYDGEFRFDRRPVPALQRSAPDRVVYAGTTSKTLDPGLRLGWLVLPDHLIADATAVSEGLTGGPSTLDQLTLSELIRTGEYERHIRRQRREYARRRAALQALLHRLGLPVPGIAAGLHAIIPLSDHTQLADALSRLTAGAVAINALSHYTRTGHAPPGLVVGYGTPSRLRVDQALQVLESSLRGLPRARSTWASERS